MVVPIDHRRTSRISTGSEGPPLGMAMFDHGVRSADVVADTDLFCLFRSHENLENDGSEFGATPQAHHQHRTGARPEASAGDRRNQVTEELTVGVQTISDSFLTIKRPRSHFSISRSRRAERHARFRRRIRMPVPQRVY